MGAGARPTDAAERIAAVTTFDRNVMVVAGAGTGKTALLTARALVYLLGESHIQRPKRNAAQRADEILALTFTEKAAAEMGERLVGFLGALSRPNAAETLEGPLVELVWEPLRQKYGLSEDEIRRRAAEALEHVERVETSTIHAFCSSLLHRYPFQAGVCPTFEVDTEGEQLDAILTQVWEAHVRDQLGDPADVADAWRTVFGAGLDLPTLQKFVRALVTSRVPTELLLEPRVLVGDPDEHAARLCDALPELERVAATIEGLDLPPKLRLGRWARVALAMGHAYASPGGRADPEVVNEWDKVLENDVEGLFNATTAKRLATRGISEEQLQPGVGMIVELVEEARAFTPVEMTAVHEICAPMIREVRERAAREGALGFEQLLVHAAELIASNAAIAARLRERYRCVLLDEVQDTDPLQYDIIKPFRGRGHTPSWGTHGSFVVGDPKQSIYLFRDADIEAFQVQTDELAQTGLSVTIDANFRSDPRIITVANALCSRLFATGNHPREVQPAYEPLTPHRESEGGDVPVEVVRVEVPGPKVSKGDCARAEIGVVIERLRALRGQFAWRDMVILVPTRTGIDELHGALQEAGIPAVFSGGRGFYTRQEVLDTVHLLASLADPSDKGALVAFLGSPAGGVGNDDLLELCAAGLAEDFTYLDVAALDRPEQHPGLGGLAFEERQRVAGVLTELARLHRCIRECETWEAFQDLRQALPVVEAWGFSRFGRQRMANVDKLLDEVEARVRAGSSLATVVREMVEQELVEREGEESALASPTLDAVTIETIHGAKGLEFRVVILANLLRDIKPETEKNLYVARDWTSGRIAARVGALRNHAARAYHLSRCRKKEAEIARLLYVALTRAKNRLVLFLYPSLRGITYSSLLTKALDEACAAGELEDDRELTIAAGGEAGREEALMAQPRRPAVPLDAIVSNIRQRREARATLQALPARLTPSSGDEPYPRRELPAEDTEAYPESRDRALRFGDLCHAVLQHLDLTQPDEDLNQALASPLAQRIAGNLYGELVDEAREVLAAAIQAPFFREVILGADQALRELAVLEDVDGATLSGRIDLAARSGTAWIVVDFKTDREIAPPEELLARYGGQKEAYSRVLGRALGLSNAPRFFLYFLRHCAAVEL